LPEFICNWGRGEAGVLALALESTNPLVILDDAVGRRVAVLLGLPLIPSRFQDEPNCPSPCPLPSGWGEGVRRTGEGQFRALLAELISG